MFVYKRPLDFYGPEDHCEGLEPDDEIVSIAARQTEWDIAWNALSWWRKLLLFFMDKG